MADKATAVSYRYGDRSAHSVFRGVTGEITVDIDTPTLWVHTGDANKPGTPLAREDLDNVTQAAITSKGIAKTDLTNVSITDSTTVRTRLLSLNYASRDLDDITDNGYATLDSKYASKNLGNVEKVSITSILDGTQESENTYAKYDLSNISQTKLANKGLAKTDLTNVTAATIKGKGIASNTLDNVTLNDATRTNLDLQKASNIISVSASGIIDNGTYPTAYSVRQALDAIPPIITNVVVDTNDTSPTVGQITITVSKALTVSAPITKKIDGQILNGTWANSSENIWVFTPASATIANIILTENWVVTVA